MNLNNLHDQVAVFHFPTFDSAYVTAHYTLTVGKSMTGSVSTRLSYRTFPLQENSKVHFTEVAGTGMAVQPLSTVNK